MTIHLTSNGGTLTFPRATAEDIANVTRWFAEAKPDETLHLSVTGSTKGIYIQKRHIVYIETGR